MFRISETLILLITFVEASIIQTAKTFAFFYVKVHLTFPEPEAMAVFHSFVALYYISMIVVKPLIFTRLGNFWTLIILGTVELIAMCGHAFFESTSLEGYFIIALILVIGFGSGGSACCIRALCLAQYELPAEFHRLKKMMFLMVFYNYLGELYAALSIGHFSSLVLTWESKMTLTLFSIAHKILGLAILIIGKNVYPKKKPTRNVLKDFVTQTWFATKIFTGKDKYFRSQFHEFTASDYERLKVLYHITPLFLPVILCLPLKEQKYTRYIHQSENMLNEVNNNYIHPLMMYSISPIVSLIALVTFKTVIIPVAAKIGRPLTTNKRFIAAMAFMVFSFSAGTILECKIEPNRPHSLAIKSAKVTIFNILPCSTVYTIQGDVNHKYTIKPMSFSISIQDNIMSSNFEKLIYFRTECATYHMNSNFKVNLAPNQLFVFVLYNATDEHSETKLELDLEQLEMESEIIGNEVIVYLRIVYDLKTATTVKLIGEYEITFELDINKNEYPPQKVQQGYYDVHVNGQYMLRQITLGSGGFYTLLISHYEEINENIVRLVETIPANTVPISLQFPQIIFLSLADVMIRAPGFIYCQNKVPILWEELVVPLWCLSGCLGNVMYAVVVYNSLIIRQLYFLYYSLLTAIISMGFYIALGETVYKYNYYEESDVKIRGTLFTLVD